LGDLEILRGISKLGSQNLPGLSNLIPVVEGASNFLDDLARLWPVRKPARRASWTGELDRLVVQCGPHLITRDGRSLTLAATEEKTEKLKR
jgi:hypothetical protein